MRRSNDQLFSDRPDLKRDVQSKLLIDSERQLLDVLLVAAMLDLEPIRARRQRCNDEVALFASCRPAAFIGIGLDQLDINIRERQPRVVQEPASNRCPMTLTG